MHTHLFYKQCTQATLIATMRSATGNKCENVMCDATLLQQNINGQEVLACPNFIKELQTVSLVGDVCWCVCGMGVVQQT